jgi:hypothetical protein
MSEIMSTVVGVSNTRVAADKDSKGRDKVTYTLSQEQAVGLVDSLASLLDAGKDKIFVEIRTEIRTSEKGNEFPSSFFIVREALPKPENIGNEKAKPAARAASLARSVRNG